MTPVAIEIQAELVSANANKQQQEATKDPAFSQFQQTYGPHTFENTHKISNNTSRQTYENYTTNQFTDDNEADSLEIFDVDGASLWDAFASFSFLFLWFQRSTLGVVGVIRSLVLGHCLQLLFRSTLVTASSNSNDSGATLEDSSPPLGVRKYFYLTQSLLLGTPIGTNGGSSSPHKQFNGAWPPPALVALAILTIVALVVHPDGMTWIVLRKIRETFMAVLQSSTTCWAIMIRDYGVLGTVSASASISLVLLLAVAMHKAFLSNCCSGSADGTAAATKRRNPLTDKKRRRRKGHRGRIKGANSNAVAPLWPRLPKVEEVSSDGASDMGGSRCNSASSEILKMIFEEQPATKTTISKEKAVDLETKRTVDRQCQEEEGASIMTSPSALESVVSEDYEAKGRTPVPSVCTVDTTAMSDDISCGSFSVRSVQQPVRQTNTRVNNKGKGNAATRVIKTNNDKANRGQKQQSTGTAKVTPVATAKNRAAVQQKSKPVTKAVTAAAETTNNRFDQQFKKPNGQKRNSGGGKGRVVATQNQNSRAGGRGKGGRVAKNQKNQPTATAPQPPTPKRASINIAPKTTPTPSATKTTTTLLTGSPIAELKKGDGNTNTSTSNNDNRLPPFSPYSQSLFSCEIGASEWSLPALPTATQPKTPESAKSPSLTPAPSYQTNPFVTLYNQMPTENNSPSRNPPVAFLKSDTSLGLWNSVQPSTPSSAPSGIDFKTTPTTTGTTPKRPLRAPPGLPTPPGFSEANFGQLSNDSPMYTPVRGSGSPSLVSAASSTYGTPLANQEAKLTWSTVGNRVTNYVQSPMSTTTTTTSNDLNGIRRSLVKENPFAEHPDEAECRIEADLQELGGQMIGSVLDF